MKTTIKTSLARGGLVTLGVLVAGAHAQAQSSVTLYGVLDAGIAYVHNAQGAGGKNESSLFKFGSGNTYGDRWGLRGKEDLGGGLAAIFQLENGFNIGTGALGQGSREFGRKAVVGLTSATYGTVTLGRQYDPVVDTVQPLTEDAYFGGTFATPGDLDNYDNSLRVNNSIKYVSPVFSGLQVEALYAFGGVAGSTGNGQTYSFGGTWSGGPLSVAAAYFFANGGNTVTNGIRAWNGTSDTLFNTVTNSGFASSKSIQIVRAGVQYAEGPFTTGLSYSNVQYARDNLSTFGSTAKFNSGSAFVNYRLTAPLLLGIGYSYTALSGPASGHYNQVNAGADYALSKRTSLYALVGYQRAGGNTLSSAGTVIPAEASIGSYGVNSGTNSQVLSVVGIRARF